MPVEDDKRSPSVLDERLAAFLDCGTEFFGAQMQEMARAIEWKTSGQLGARHSAGFVFRLDGQEIGSRRGEGAHRTQPRHAQAKDEELSAFRQ